MDNQNDATYWKKKLEEVERELEDFRESSSLLEKELESALEQSDKQIRELRHKNNSLQMENDTIKERLTEIKRSSEQRVSELEEENGKLRKKEEECVGYIRELEQKNDDLERSQRALFVSLGDFETKLNAALERNVLLESELDEKEILQGMVQRLKDEARDLKQEIQIRDQTLPTPDNDVQCSIIDSNKTPLKGETNGVGYYGNSANTQITMTPPERLCVMNLVADLLRKISALEAKMSSCQGASRESISPNDGREAFRGKRLNRGTSIPSILN